MDSKKYYPAIAIFIVVLTLKVLFQGGFSFFGFEYSNGKQGKIIVVNISAPEAPSQVFGIGKAMKEGKSIIIFRQLRKASALNHCKRNFYFISKLMESYAPKVKVIELSSAVSYPNGDYFMKILDEMPANGFGIMKKGAKGYKLYKSTFGYSENYDEIVLPVKERVEEVLGKCKFSKKKLIAKKSKYKAYNEAMKYHKHLVMYSFADACNSIPSSKQAKIIKMMQSNFSKKAKILKINHNFYTDPANELYSKGNNIVIVYNCKTKKTYPALFTKSDTKKNIEEALAKR